MIPGLFAAQAVSMGPRLWTPSHLVEPPKVWVDWESDITNESGAVASWNNGKGSIGGAFNQVSQSRRPMVISSDPDIGGKRAISFDGSDDWIRMGTTESGNIFRNVGAGWMFALYKKRAMDDSAVTRNLLYAPNVTGATRFNSMAAFSGSPMNYPTLAIRRLDSDSSSTLINAGSAVSGYMMRFDIADWAGGSIAMRVNGAQVASASLPMSGNTSDTASNGNYLSVGAEAHASAFENHSDVDLALLMIGSGALLPTPVELQRLEGWAAWQCGLVGNLPISHPYKDAPPYV